MTEKIKYTFENILLAAKEGGASDVHMLRDMPPMARIGGSIGFLDKWKSLSHAALMALTEAILEPHQYEQLKREREISVSYISERCGRQRVTCYHRLGTVEMSIRLTQTAVNDRQGLGLPPVLDSIVANKSGLILVTGPTGSGKTTTLNYMINSLNKSMNGKIVTIEDPVEFEHNHDRSIITQIEVGADTLSFPSFLRSVLRLDPDVIVIGEMRDLETMSTALTGAETGHLVLATLHTPSAVATAGRIVNSFPGEMQQQVALQVASTIIAVVSQRLVPARDEHNRVLATEVMLGTNAVRNLIRDRDFHMIPNAIQIASKQGMHSLEQSLVSLYRQKMITKEMAYAYANDEALLKSMFEEQAAQAVYAQSQGG